MGSCVQAGEEADATDSEGYASLWVAAGLGWLPVVQVAPYAACIMQPAMFMRALPCRAPADRNMHMHSRAHRPRACASLLSPIQCLALLCTAFGAAFGASLESLGVADMSFGTGAADKRGLGQPLAQWRGHGTRPGRGRGLLERGGFSRNHVCSPLAGRLGPFSARGVPPAASARRACRAQACRAQVQELLAHRALVDCACGRGNTALFAAAQEGHVEVVQTLLEARAAPGHDRDEYGNFPLHAAAQEGHEKVVRALLECVPDKQRLRVAAACNAAGETALHMAARFGHHEAAAALLAEGCSPLLPRLDGTTAVQLASKGGHAAVIRVFDDTH
jgi:hypothetical protein